MLQYVATPSAPKPGGHYSQAVVSNGFVFIAGQLPFTVEKVVPEGIEAQAELVLENIRAILEASGSGMGALVSIQIFITDLKDWPSVDAACQRAFGEHKPARTVVPCGALRHGAIIEANATAHLLPRNGMNHP
jgi:2-iminobutanoate/2-iminopropanoate deaminase